MELILESQNLNDYLLEIPSLIEFHSPFVRKTIDEIKSKTDVPKERAKIAFEIARDEIKHSFDTKFQEITISSEESLAKNAGICFAKSHVLASLLRGMNIPTGFCYQRVLRDGKTVASGHALHGLNAIYFEDTGWFRVDPRGNKLGIDSQFRWDKEQLAYPIRPELGEVDYPTIYTKPLESVILSMKNSKNTAELFYNRPEAI